MKTNRDRIVDSAKDSYVEQLKSVLAFGASLLDCNDLEKLTHDTIKEMLSFLRAVSQPIAEKPEKVG